MRIRKAGPCRSCSHWRNVDSLMLAGTAAPVGECRRRVQPGEDGLHPQQPVTQAGIECSEHSRLPASERHAQCCGDCQYWQPPKTTEISAADKGHCRVWAPRWSVIETGHAFPITRRDFYCGDGASLSYVDPEEEEDS